jgi:hypothetical protein
VVYFNCKVNYSFSLSFFVDVDNKKSYNEGDLVTEPNPAIVESLHS